MNIHEANARYEANKAAGFPDAPGNLPFPELLERLENPDGDRCEARKLGGWRCTLPDDHSESHDFGPPEEAT